MGALFIGGIRPSRKWDGQTTATLAWNWQSGTGIQLNQAVVQETVNWGQLALRRERGRVGGRALEAKPFLVARLSIAELPLK